jgi:hypothetical protein
MSEPQVRCGYKHLIEYSSLMNRGQPWRLSLMALLNKLYLWRTLKTFAHTAVRL